MATEDGEISDGELESSEDEDLTPSVPGGPNEPQVRKFVTQHSEPYTLFTSRKSAVKGHVSEY